MLLWSQYFSFPCKMNKANRLYSNIHIRNTVYTVIGVGVMANALLLLVHISLHITGHRPKPTDLPIGLLALIHLVILLIKGFIASDIFIPQGGRWESKFFCCRVCGCHTMNYTTFTTHFRQSRL